MSNPFGLIYGGAIEANEPGKVNIRPVRYTVQQPGSLQPAREAGQAGT